MDGKTPEWGLLDNDWMVMMMSLRSACFDCPSVFSVFENLWLTVPTYILGIPSVQLVYFYTIS